MTNDQIQQVKIIGFANWLLARKFGTEIGIRDTNSMENVVSLPGGGSLTCFLGEKLSNRRDLYTQLGWYVYYMISGEPFNSKNRSTTLLMISWCLKYYQIDYDIEALRDFIRNMDSMKQGNSDISLWFSSNCH
ncbi:MAG: hypothetical protein COT43_03020 [Candidatus Marinimicrobia bacterium CG08_land_8_20_14_0_20_45_22]|nr:MAG: hypothetical protein COT43_03020 [Candidatus Marinimicrobia bacterium CG08_land_8_20_14_0_20_45_22]